MSLYLLEKQNIEIKRKYYKESITGLLHKNLSSRVRKEIESDRILKFKKMRITVKDSNGFVYPNLQNVALWDVILQCSINGLNRLYDILYDSYCRGETTPDEWCAFENLSERRVFHVKKDNSIRD